MADLESFLPQEDLLEETSKASPEPTSEFGDTENEELLKICDNTKKILDDANVKSGDNQKNPDSGYTSSISENDNLRLSPAGKTPAPKTPPKTPPKSPSEGANKSPKSTSPNNKRILFSPENHRKHISDFKQRQAEKKMSLDERRKKQNDELEKKKQAILKKHEEADKRVQERLRNVMSPKKTGTFGSSSLARSALHLNYNESRRSGSIQNLSTLKDSVQLRPKSATPRLRRPVSMGAIPTSIEQSTFKRGPGVKQAYIPPFRGTSVQQPVIKRKEKKEENKLKNKADIKSLLKPSKVGGFSGLRKKPAVKDVKAPEKAPITAPPTKRKSSLDGKSSDTKSNTLERKKSLERKSLLKGANSQRSTSPSKAVMNQTTQDKVNAQEEAKQRLAEARKKAREERVKQEEEQRRLEEERRIEEERRRIEADEARERMLKEKENRRKQVEEEERIEAERVKKEEEEKTEQERVERENKQKDEQERLELQRTEHELRRQKEEERVQKEEQERRERQKKLDAILKRSSVKMDTVPKREISANASAILAKHNIQLPAHCVRHIETSEADSTSNDDVDERPRIPSVEVSEPPPDTPENGNHQVDEDNVFGVDKAVDINSDPDNKEANEFTIGITSTEELHLSQVL